MLRKPLFVASLFLFLAACGRPMEARKIVSTVTVDGSEVLLEAEEVDFSTAPKYQNQTPVETTLAKESLGLRLDPSGFEDFDIQLKLSGNRTLRFQNVESQKPETAVSTDTTGNFGLTLNCANADCDSALITIMDRNKVEQTEFQYRRRAEFLSRESIRHLQGTTETLDALRMAIDALTTVQRHTVQLKGGKTFDLLVVVPPIPDGGAVNFSDVDDDEFFAEEPVAIDETPYIEEIEIVSSGSGIRILEKAPAITPDEPTETSTPQEQNPDNEEASKKNETDRPNGENAPAAAVDSCGTGNGLENCSGRIVLTPNPWKAFGFTPPPRLFKTNAAISDPTRNIIAMAIEPATASVLDEPAHRISVLAQEFINQNIRISQNACNFYVRAVMVLSGYINTRSYLANDWDDFFRTRNHGLDQWRKFEYRWTGNARSNAAKSEQFKAQLKNMREGYGVIYQYVNSNGPGHVAMLHRENGKVHYYDAMLNRRGPARLMEGDATPAKRLNLDKLFRARYPKVRLFAIPGLLDPSDN